MNEPAGPAGSPRRHVRDFWCAITLITGACKGDVIDIVFLP
jgi:hypothetical protein